MPQTFTTTGGARIGWVNASWGLAKLSATPDKLTLSVRLLGTYSFTPDQVSAIEKYVKIPVLSSGIRIHHCNNDCSARVVFWCLGNPDAVLKGIHDAGFLPAAASSSVPQRQNMAIRWSVIVIAIAVWSGLFSINFSFAGGIPRLSPHMLVPLACAFALSIGTLVSPALQKLVLKPSRSVGEIKPLLRLLAFIFGFLLVFYSILWASGALTNTVNNH